MTAAWSDEGETCNYVINGNIRKEIENELKRDIKVLKTKQNVIS